MGFPRLAGVGDVNPLALLGLVGWLLWLVWIMAYSAILIRHAPTPSSATEEPDRSTEPAST